MDLDIEDILRTIIGYASAALLAAFVFVAVRRVWKLSRGSSSDADDKKPQDLKCPECGYDLRATPHECPECGAVVVNRRRYLRSLGRDWPVDAIEPCEVEDTRKEATVELLVTDNQTEADLLRQQLTARGIRCAVARQGSSHKDVYGMNYAHYFQVCVPASDERFAREYLCRAQGIPAELLEEVLAGERKVVVA